MNNDPVMAGDQIGLRVGERLALVRAERGLTLAEVAAATRIPIRHLKTIESGNYDGLPAPTYSAGFVKSYARLLDLNGQALSDEFRAETGLAGQIHQPASYAPADPARTPPKALALLALLIAVIGGLGYLYWRGSTEQPIELAAAASDQAVPAPAATNIVAAAAPPVAEPQAAPPATASGPVVVAADKDVWLRISERGGATLYMGLMKAGDSFTVPATAADPVLTTGRPGSTRVSVGGSVVPPLGDPDHIVKDVSLKAEALLGRINAPASATTAPADNAATPN